MPLITGQIVTSSDGVFTIPIPDRPGAYVVENGTGKLRGATDASGVYLGDLTTTMDASGRVRDGSGNIIGVADIGTGLHFNPVVPGSEVVDTAALAAAATAQSAVDRLGAQINAIATASHAGGSGYPFVWLTADTPDALATLRRLQAEYDAQRGAVPPTTPSSATATTPDRPVVTIVSPPPPPSRPVLPPPGESGPVLRSPDRVVPPVVPGDDGQGVPSHGNVPVVTGPIATPPVRSGPVPPTTAVLDVAAPGVRGPGAVVVLIAALAAWWAMRRRS